MTADTWKPTASLTVLRERAALLANIRQFFAQKDVLEVTTPCLSHAGVTDPYLDNFSVAFQCASTPQNLYLQTSPEYAMKRLLASGSGDIYQIAPAFRHEGAGRLHNPEFTMLEWYRVGFDMQMLIDEVAEFLQILLPCNHVEQLTYQNAFLRYCQFDPLLAAADQLCRVCAQHGIDLYDTPSALSKDNLLQLIFNVLIEPNIGKHAPTIISHFPASQAALAKINKEDARVAERFEVYYRGVELANGFNELTNSNEQRKRFTQDNVMRQQSGLPKRAIDEHLLAAMAHGLPDCAGVAVGFDRLLLLKLGLTDLSDVMTFPVSRA